MVWGKVRVSMGVRVVVRVRHRACDLSALDALDRGEHPDVLRRQAAGRRRRRGAICRAICVGRLR
jgi:hypothetical protein